MNASPRPRIADVSLALLAGGLATRLQAVTEGALPKALVDVGGRPFIDHQLELFHRHGVRRVVLCLGHLGKMVESHVGDGSALGMNVTYSHDGPGLLGTGGALRRAMSGLSDPFWVVYGDSYVDIDYGAILDAFHAAPPETLALMTVLKNENRWDRSNVRFEDGRLIRYDKHRPTPDMRHVDYGVALLHGVALQRIPPAHPYDLADLYSQLVSERRMVGYEVTNRFYEIGTPGALDEARAFFASRQSA